MEEVMKTKTIVALVVMLFTAQARATEMPQGLYLDGGASKLAVILAHGQGEDPDSHVVSPLRKAIHKELGMHTLSLQMPVLPGKKTQALFEEYAETFPDAYKSIQAAIDFLRKEKEVERIYLMGYSMGGRMTTGFLAEHPDSGIVGYIGVGLLGGGKVPLNTNLNLRKILQEVKIPVIDIYAEDDRDAKSAAPRKHFISDHYKQIPVPGAKHDYSCCEQQVVKDVIAWLKEQEEKAKK
jgi:dienelactone hydrolase